MWHIIKDEYGKLIPCGEYKTKKDALSHAPDIVYGILNKDEDFHIDEKDNMVGDFMVNLFVKVKGRKVYKIFLARDMFDAWGRLKK